MNHNLIFTKRVENRNVTLRKRSILVIWVSRNGDGTGMERRRVGHGNRTKTLTLRIDKHKKFVSELILN